jgi:glycerol-3-phosphate acyltransferase PlsY
MKTLIQTITQYFAIHSPGGVLMQVLIDIAVFAAAYLFGSIPFGLLVVKAISGRDIRQVESGRTGGTNAMRAAGFGAGILTAILDILKSAATVWVARAVTSTEWIHVLAPIAAIIGHNHSIFLIERDEKGHIRLRGGAGGAAALGGSFGLWWPSIFIILPIGFGIWYGIGYASVTTLSVGLMAFIIFAIRAALGLSPWEYALYGLLAEVLLILALRPNIKRLLNGTERLHGWRAKRQEKKVQEEAKQDSGPDKRPE